MNLQDIALEKLTLINIENNINFKDLEFKYNIKKEVD